jgi:hypothetical protein
VYDRVDPITDVGIVFSYASEVWDYWSWANATETNHSLQWYGLAQALTDMSVQYSAVFAPDGKIIPDHLSIEELLKYETIIIPWAYSLNDEQIQLFEEYAGNGKKLIIVGDFATFDEQKEPRSSESLAHLQALGAIIVPGLNFESYLNDPHSSNASAVLDALKALIPNKSVTIANTDVTVNLNRKDQTLYGHLVNKARSDSGFQVQADFPLTIVLPPDLESSNLQVFYTSPDFEMGDSIPLSVTIQGRSIHVTIPELAIYGVLIITKTD